MHGRGQTVAPIAKKVGLAILTFLTVIALTFILFDSVHRVTARKWARDISERYGVEFEVVYKDILAWLGVDPEKSLVQGYWEFLKDLSKGDLGESWFYEEPVGDLILRALPWTAFVLSVSMILSFFIGVSLGTMMAWKRRSFIYPLVTIYASITGATPDWIIGLILLVILAIYLKLFPIAGAYDTSLAIGFNWPFVRSALHHAALPILAFTFEATGTWALAMKGSAMTTLGEDYVMAARARGLKERRIMTAYVGRNALLPLVTRLAIRLGRMLGITTIIESVFSYPGIGLLFGKALEEGDYVVMKGVFLLIAVVVILANLMVDIIYPRLDPRIKIS
jgi:peptide/nickel transport system permease protein